jgi:NADH-quinone oxidoreductase subunit F
MAGLGTTFVLPDQPIDTVEDYLSRGGGAGLDAARRLGPEAVVEEMIASGLRGRGGAGFPTGVKWRSVQRGGGGIHYAVANGAEGEPATFKDRMLMRRDPYRVVEGLAIAAFAVGATQAYCATKRKYAQEVAALRRAALEMSTIGLLGELEISIVEGPEEYLFGEEKALLEVIEGRDPLPTLLPPWQRGLFATVQLGWEADVSRGQQGRSNPTVVDNVETLAAATHILAKGAGWFRSMGTPESPGTVIVTIVGDVQRSLVREVECGTPFRAVLDECGGPRPGRRLVAAFSGVSNSVLTAEHFDVPLTYEDMEAAGTGLGAAGFVLYDDAADMVSVARELSRFLAVESCGQCPACKTGCMEITDRLLAIEEGAGTDDDLAEINARLRTVTDANRCFLGTEEQNVVSSILRAFPEAFAGRLEGSAGPLRPALVPLIEDILEDGTVVYDERHVRKRPDWTYA